MTDSLVVTVDYSNLVSDLQSIIQKGQQVAFSAVNQIRLQTYWDMGKRIAETQAQIISTEESEAFVGKLSADLGLDKTLLYRISQFYRTWPDGIPTIEGTVLSWTHHVELLSIKNKEERQFYLEAASKEEWGRSDLRKAIQKDYFNSVKNEAADAATGLTLERPKNPLHVYKAVVEKVVDGDTLLVRIDLGFDVWVSQRIRFRGINTAELIRNGVPVGKTPDRAEQAKAFVEEKLRDLEFIVIKTYKTDMYGRYVVDAFYSPLIKEKEAVYEMGFFLNADLLKAGLADLML